MAISTAADPFGSPAGSAAPFAAPDMPAPGGGGPLMPPPLPPGPGAPEPAPSWSGSYPAPPAKSGMSTGAKIAIGVGVGFLVLVGLAVIAGISFFRSVADSDEFQAAIQDFEVTSQGTVDFTIGDCFDYPNSAGAISCSEPHSHEVFGLVPWADTTTYPDYDEVWSTVFCDDAFESYVGVEYFASELFYDIALPSQAAWDGGDYNVRCIAYEPSVTLTRSVQNAAY